MPNAPTAAPVTKVIAATLGAAAATIIVATVTAIWNLDTPAGVEGALATLLAFLAGYIVPAAESEVVYRP